MPAKYVIHTEETPNRFKPLSRSGIIAWEEGCLKCPVCVKRQCVYGVYDKRGIDARQMLDSIDYLCMNCFRCIQNCPKELIHKSVNPEYKEMGDYHWSPDIISRLWYQAETGKIPVSGAGYPGPFFGSGFDSMWTDMSEIVRPTRDGIHGREYISTMVDLGRTPQYLTFGENAEIEQSRPQVISVPVPILIRVPEFGELSELTFEGWARAASMLGTLFALPSDCITMSMSRDSQFLVPILSLAGGDQDWIPEGVRMVEIEVGEEDDAEEILNFADKKAPGALVSARIPVDEGVEDRTLNLVKAGVPIVHLQGTWDGRWQDDETRFLKDGIRFVHLALVEEGLRDSITLLASGGIAMAEHVAKSIICGADAVYLDFPILIALECRMCRRCLKDLPCPVEIGQAERQWVAKRVRNLVGAFHNQLLEVMGAMGMRDARRLRGEAGRAMFFEELDQRTFGQLGTVEEDVELE